MQGNAAWVGSSGPRGLAAKAGGAQVSLRPPHPAPSRDEDTRSRRIAHVRPLQLARAGQLATAAEERDDRKKLRAPRACGPLAD